MAPKVRGGHRQKRRKLIDASAALEDSEASATPGASDASRGHVPVNDTSSLATTLLTRWGEGQLSAIDVQQFAQAAVQDGATHPEITWIAQLGSHGLHPGNVSRDLKAKYLQETLAPEPYSAKISLFTTKDRTATVEQNVDLLLPHEWFAKLASSFGPWDFDEQFGAAIAPEWWADQDMNNPKFFEHPLLDIADWRKVALPVVIHADGAKFQERDSLLTISLKGLLFSRTSKKDAHMLIGSLPKSVSTKEAVEEIWAVVHWSCVALLDGRHPPTDHLGNEWPAGSSRAKLAGKPLHPARLRGVVWGVSGDLDFFSKELGLPGPAANEFCFRCTANRSDMPWNDFRETAAWRGTVLHAADLLQVPDCKLPAPQLYDMWLMLWLSVLLAFWYCNGLPHCNPHGASHADLRSMAPVFIMGCPMVNDGCQMSGSPQW
jgi:hypothetical protein